MPDRMSAGAPKRRLALALTCLATISLAVTIVGCGKQQSGSAAITASAASSPSAPSGSGYFDDNASPDQSLDQSASDYEQRQSDWENQEGDDWDTFNAAYSEGWDTGCEDAFQGSPDGSLYDQGDEFTSSDCQANNPGDASSVDIPPDVPDDAQSDGDALGETDGCISAFEDLPSDGGGVLYYGEDGYDESVCP